MELDEGFGDWLGSGLQAVDKATGWINSTAAMGADILRYSAKAHQEIARNPELQAAYENKGSILDIMRKLAQYDPKQLEAEGKKILSNQDAGEVIAAWQRSSVHIVLELLFHFGEILHITQIFRAIPGQVAAVWEKMVAVKRAASLYQKAQAIIALVGAFLAMLHFFLSSAFISGLMAKVAALFHQYLLGGELLIGAYIVWGLLIVLGIAHSKTSNKVLHWLINFVFAVFNPAHKTTKPVPQSDRLRRFFGTQKPEQPQQESTLYDLHQSAVDAFPGTTKRQHAVDPVRIVQMSWSPFVGLKTLYLKALAQNPEGTRGYSEYHPQILFKNVPYGEGQVHFIADDGREYTVPILSDRDALVRCDCKDFYWRFNYYDHLDHSLYGRKRSKYEGQGLWAANPQELPGMCKHLMKFSMALRDAGLIAG